jgi:hypothetical protein
MKTPQTRTIGSNVVLPNLPYSPEMPSFAQMDITTETLAGHNAGMQSLMETGPRPAPTIVKQPVINVPAVETKSLAAWAAAASPGHSIDGENYNSIRPTHTLEVYGNGPSFDLSHIQMNGAESYSSPFVHTSIRESHGGNPRFEAEHMAYRPKNPTRFAPEIKIQPTKRRIPIRERVVTPKANLPNLMDFSKLIKKSESNMTFAAKPVAPPIRGADLGGLLNSTSLHGGFANSNGRNIGNSSI